MRTRGFTLIEVLVALAIVTVGMAAALGAVTSAADTVFYLRDKTLANWVALNRIAELRLQAQLPEKGKSTGEAEMGGRKWVWEQNVQPVEVKGMWRIDVSVRPAEGSGDAKNSWFATLSGIVGDALNRQSPNPNAASTSGSWDVSNSLIKQSQQGDQKKAGG